MMKKGGINMVKLQRKYRIIVETLCQRRKSLTGYNRTEMFWTIHGIALTALANSDTEDYIILSNLGRRYR